jgi:4-carboxymuconolactone decarboxylase
MARVSRVSASEGGLLVKLAYHFGRKQLTGLTGRSPQDGLEPIEVFAHLPKLLLAYGHIEQVTSKLSQVDEKLKTLAELKAATLTNCEYCIDIGSQIARRTGLTDEQLLALPTYQTSSLFSEVEKLVLDYAVGISRTPVDVPDELFAKLRTHFTDPQLVELTYVIALENLRGRFNLALDIGAAGFTEGMVCAIPERPAE